MKTITIYETDDEVQYDFYPDALAHEECSEIVQHIMDFLDTWPDDYVDPARVHGYIQHNVDELKWIKSRLLRVLKNRIEDLKFDMPCVDKALSGEHVEHLSFLRGFSEVENEALKMFEEPFRRLWNHVDSKGREWVHAQYARGEQSWASVCIKHWEDRDR